MYTYKGESIFRGANENKKMLITQILPEIFAFKYCESVKNSYLRCSFSHFGGEQVVHVNFCTYGADRAQNNEEITYNVFLNSTCSFQENHKNLELLIKLTYFRFAHEIAVFCH